MNGFRRENSEIVIILEKTKKTWWKSVIVGHSEIDTTKVMFDMMRMLLQSFCGIAISRLQ